MAGRIVHDFAVLLCRMHIVCFERESSNITVVRDNNLYVICMSCKLLNHGIRDTDTNRRSGPGRRVVSCRLKSIGSMCHRDHKKA
jgi:hypothetical protein